MNVLHGIELVFDLLLGLIITGLILVAWYTTVEILHWMPDDQRAIATGVVLVFIATFLIGCLL